MTMRLHAPCLRCGADSLEIRQWLDGEHEFIKSQMFVSEYLCDFCYADIPSGPPEVWGFPADSDWRQMYLMDDYDRAPEKPPLRTELGCRHCEISLRYQEFICGNALRHGVALSEKWWPFLDSEGAESRGC